MKFKKPVLSLIALTLLCGNLNTIKDEYNKNANNLIDKNAETIYFETKNDLTAFNKMLKERLGKPEMYADEKVLVWPATNINNITEKKINLCVTISETFSPKTNYSKVEKSFITIAALDEDKKDLLEKGSNTQMLFSEYFQELIYLSVEPKKWYSFLRKTTSKKPSSHNNIKQEDVKREAQSSRDSNSKQLERFEDKDYYKKVHNINDIYKIIIKSCTIPKRVDKNYKYLKCFYNHNFGVLIFCKYSSKISPPSPENPNPSKEYLMHTSTNLLLAKKIFNLCSNDTFEYVTIATTSEDGVTVKRYNRKFCNKVQQNPRGKEYYSLYNGIYSASQNTLYPSYNEFENLCTKTKYLFKSSFGALSEPYFIPYVGLVVFADDVIIDNCDIIAFIKTLSPNFNKENLRKHCDNLIICIHESESKKKVFLKKLKKKSKPTVAEYFL